MGYSIERLFRYLNMLDQDLEIIVKPSAGDKNRLEVTLTSLTHNLYYNSGFAAFASRGFSWGFRFASTPLVYGSTHLLFLNKKIPSLFILRT
jgi:hypothetical protein